MREFSKISPALWHSKRFNGLETAEEKLVFFYLLTSEHQNSAGAYRLPAGYTATDLRVPVERFEAAREKLVKAQLIMFDADTDEYFIQRWFKHNPPMNPDHRTGIERQLEKLDSGELYNQARTELNDTEASKRKPRNSEGNQKLELIDDDGRIPVPKAFRKLGRG